MRWRVLFSKYRLNHSDKMKTFEMPHNDSNDDLWNRCTDSKRWIDVPDENATDQEILAFLEHAERCGYHAEMLQVLDSIILQAVNRGYPQSRQLPDSRLPPVEKGQSIERREKAKSIQVAHYLPLSSHVANWNKRMVIGAILVIICTVGVTFYINSITSPKHLNLVFTQSHNLNPGDPIVFNDLIVGEVKKVSLYRSSDGSLTYPIATLQIDNDNFEMIHRGMEFRVEKLATLTGLKRVRIVEENAGISYLPLNNGDIVLLSTNSTMLEEEIRFEESRSQRRKLGERVTGFFTILNDSLPVKDTTSSGGG